MKRGIRRDTERSDKVKKFLVLLSLVCMVAAIGFAGAVQQNMMPFGRGLLLYGMCIAGFAFFSRLGGAWYKT